MSDGGFDDVSGGKAPAANNELAFINKGNQHDVPREENKMQNPSLSSCQAFIKQKVLIGGRPRDFAVSVVVLMHKSGDRLK